MCLRAHVSENNKEESNGFASQGALIGKAGRIWKEGFWLVEGQFVKVNLVVVAQLYSSFLNKHTGRFLDCGSSRKALGGSRIKLYQGGHQRC